MYALPGISHMGPNSPDWQQIGQILDYLGDLFSVHFAKIVLKIDLKLKICHNWCYGQFGHKSDIHMY